MPNDSKVSQLILSLTRATVENEIEWKFADPPRSIALGTDDVISSYLEAFYKGQRLVLYERRYTSYDPEHDSQYWTSNRVFAILDKEGRVIWDYTGGYALLDVLYQVARDSAAKIDQIISELSQTA